MSKFFNLASIMFSVIGAFFVKHLGGIDTLLHVLVALVVIDYATGVLKAIVNKRLSSKIGFKGIAKKVAIFLVVAVAVKLELIIGDTIPIREIVILFYIANEGISFLENIAEFVSIPEKLKEIFLQIRDSNTEKGTKE